MYGNFSFLPVFQTIGPLRLPTRCNKQEIAGKRPHSMACEKGSLNCNFRGNKTMQKNYQGEHLLACSVMYLLYYETYCLSTLSTKY